MDLHVQRRVDGNPLDDDDPNAVRLTQTAAKLLQRMDATGAVVVCGYPYDGYEALSPDGTHVRIPAPALQQLIEAKLVSRRYPHGLTHRGEQAALQLKYQ